MDAAARDHDLGYSKLQQSGLNPYLIYNSADRDFQERIQTEKSFEGNLARGLFQLKKRLFPHAGAVLPGSSYQASLPSESAGVPSGSATEGGVLQTKPRGGKRRGPAALGSSGKRPKVPMSGAAGGANADPPGTGLEAGAAHAVGSWNNSASWREGSVTTSATRVWALPSYDNHIYKQLSNTTGNTGADRYLGWSTPWGYFDFNRFHVFWSPRNWQRLINGYTGFRPRKLRVRIHQIQIKEVSVQNGTTQIATSLSSTVQVLADEQGVLPYVMASATQGTLSPFPNDVTVLPQYGYTTIHMQGKATGESSFFCLEGMNSSLLRTGDEIEFEYSFPELPFHSAFQVGQFLHQQANPLVGQYLLICTGTGNDGKPKYAKPQKGKYSTFHQNHMYGPALKYNMLNTDDLSKGQNYKGIQSTQWEGINPRTYVHGLGWVGIRPGPPTYNTTGSATAPNTNLNFDCSDSRYQTGQEPQQPYVGEDTELVYTNASGNRISSTQVTVNDSGDGASEATGNMQSANSLGNNTVLYERGLLPGMVWTDRDVYLCGPIWGKIPHTDGKVHPAPLIGGFGCSNPPPMILIKNTPTPANPPVNFSDKFVNSFLTQYSTGLITLEMEWELDKSQVPKWNPDMQFTYATSMAQANWFVPDAQGKYHEGLPVGSRYQTKHL